MSKSNERRYLLFPQDGPPSGRGPRVRITVADTSLGELRLVQRGEVSVLFLDPKQESRGDREVFLSADMAEALTEAWGGRTISALDVDVDSWRLRLYEGKLYGLVVGYTQQEEIPPVAPKGWILGPDITDDPRYREAALVGLSEEEANALLGESHAAT